MTKTLKFSIAATTIIVVAALSFVAMSVFADSTVSTDFEGFTLGTVDGQDGWVMTGPYDIAVTSSFGVPGYGTKSLRMSDAVTGGGFDQAYAKPLTDAAGEADSTDGTFSRGTLTNHFEAQFQIRSMQLSQQPGLHIEVSPDRGDGSRMSFLRFDDLTDGIHVYFDDVTDPGPLGIVATFNETDIGTINRSETHTIKFVMDFKNGPGNDDVEIFIDGVSVHSGTSWEDYYRFDPEASGEQSPRIVKTLLFHMRHDNAPATNGLGYLVDNVSLESSTVVIPPATLIVDDNNECPGATYTTIQDAVTAANSGDTIQICAGTYDQGANTITVNKSLTFSGPNAAVSPNGGSRVAEAIIQGNVPGGSNSAFNIGLDSVTVAFKGLEFETEGSAMRSDSQGATISLEKNIFTATSTNGTVYYGIFFWDPNLTVTDNLFTSFIGNEDTIQMGIPGSAPIGSISITDNTWQNVSTAALNLSDVSGTVSGNTFDGIQYYGVLVAGTANLTISNNVFNNISNPDPGTSDTWGAGVRFYDTVTPSTSATITGNTFSNSYLGVSVKPAADISGAAIAVNRNAFTGNTPAGIRNEASATLDASCNWWGDASGPGPVGPGTGDGVSANVDFSTWLTTSLLTGPCNGPLPGVTVTMVKNIDGIHATAASANSSSFPMLETWVATNFSGTDVAFDLSPAGVNTANEYEAVTSPAFDSGANFTMHEVTGGAVVGANCAAGKPFALVGYTTGDTEAEAAAASPSLTEPSFTDMTSDKYVIVWNHKCPPPPPSAPPANACNTPTIAPVGYTLVNGTAGNDDVTIAPFTMFVGLGGYDTVNGPADGNYIVCTGVKTDKITLGNGDFTISAGDGYNVIVTGNGAGYIEAGVDADTITTGDGVQTIHAGNGYNKIVTGNGDKNITAGIKADQITTGSGNDVINAGAGYNNIKSGAGNDSITTGANNDMIDGGPDTDTCNAGGGYDSVVNCEA